MKLWEIKILSFISDKICFFSLILNILVFNMAYLIFSMYVSPGTKEEIEIAKQLIDSNIMTEIEIRRRREHRQVNVAVSTVILFINIVVKLKNCFATCIPSHLIHSGSQKSSSQIRKPSRYRIS